MRSAMATGEKGAMRRKTASGHQRASRTRAASSGESGGPDGTTACGRIATSTGTVATRAASIISFQITSPVRPSSAASQKKSSAVAWGYLNTSQWSPPSEEARSA